MGPSNLLFSLVLSFLLVMLITKVESQNSTTFNIDAFTPHSLLLTYERDAFVPPDTTYVRLVPGPNHTGSSVGRVLYSAPVELWELLTQASFETTITFQMTPLLIGASFGMTFFMVPVNSTTTTGGYHSNLGIYDAVIPGSAIFAVEFDLDLDGFDPPYPHIGININSLRSQNTTRFDDATSTLVTARITYDVPTRVISVVATYGSNTATVSFAFNLKALLPRQVQLGLSASTSETGIFAPVINFDAFTWHFNSTMVSDVNSVVVDDNTYIKQYVM
ncbi:hypothetical protein ACS0TY_007190 [Phlomoides rotata]